MLWLLSFAHLDLGEGEIFDTEKDVPTSLVGQKITYSRVYLQFILIQRLNAISFFHKYSKKASIVL